MFVTGCHRSGTSLLASLMHGLVTGKDPRQRRGDLEQKLENPLGFFESERLVETNEALLEVLGCQWDCPPVLPASWDQSPLLGVLQLHRSRLMSYALEHAWVDKDPRLCITYPAYFHILLRRIPLVVALREPLAVATSLHARNGFSLNRGLVLWWIYNHHIASHLCKEDLLVPYGELLSQDCKGMDSLLGPFLELHNHLRPTEDQIRVLLSSLLKPEFNRSEASLNAEGRAHVHPELLQICDQTYKNIIHSGDQLSGFKQCFNSVPRVVLECSSRAQLISEAKALMLHNRLLSIDDETKSLVFSLEQRNRECDSLRRQISDLQGSQSWKITAPLRALFGLFRLVAK